MIADRLTSALEGHAFRRALRHLLDLLERERDLLREADFASVVALSPKLEAALSGLPAPPEGERGAAEAALREIRALAERNQRLLAAALAGTRQARADLEAMRQAERRLGYDRSGGSVAIRGGGAGGRRA